MNKRNKKKMLKKCLPVIADEANLIMMADDERKAALKDYFEYVRKYAYRKKYKDLKGGKALWYYYPTPKGVSEFLTSMYKRGRKPDCSSHTVTQRLEDIEGINEFAQKLNQGAN